MNKEYKILVLNHLYGLIQGSAKDLERIIKNSFERRFNIQPDVFKATQHDTFTTTDPKMWVGVMEVLLEIDGEVFVCSRNWLEEYEIDKQHPNYTDEYFYDGTDNHSYKKLNELINALD